MKSPVKAAVKARKTKATKPQTIETVAAARIKIKSKPKPGTARKPGTKARKAA